jgi:hypothetical protein
VPDSRGRRCAIPRSAAIVTGLGKRKNWKGAAVVAEGSPSSSRFGEGPLSLEQPSSDTRQNLFLSNSSSIDGCMSFVITDCTPDSTFLVSTSSVSCSVRAHRPICRSELEESLAARRSAGARERYCSTVVALLCIKSPALVPPGHALRENSSNWFFAHEQQCQRSSGNINKL